MKRFSVFLLLVSLLSAVTINGLGQSGQVRPRRVGDQPQTVPETTAPEPARPGKPPVLGGANYPNNRQPEPQPEQTPTGPEEVDAGD